MKTRWVINSKNRVINLPITPTLVLYLFLDKLNAPGWVWGATWVFVGIFWIVAIIDMCNRKELPAFTADKNQKIASDFS